MARTYDQPVISGFNNGAPPDDGSQTAANEITWSGIKTKLADPIKVYVDAINQEADVSFSEVFPSGVSSISATYTVQATDNGKVLNCSNTITVTLLPVATAGDQFMVLIRNSGTGTVTVDGDGAETINGSATLTLGAKTAALLVCDGSSWTAVDIATLSGINTYTKAQKWSKGADVASATALTLGTDGNYFDVTGITAITSIGTLGVGTWIKLHFDAALTLTHHATDLILPGGANITTAAGDEAEFVEYATGDWRCTSYQRASGAETVIHTKSQVFTASGTFNVPEGVSTVRVLCVGGGGGGGSGGSTATNTSPGGGGGGAGGQWRFAGVSVTPGGSEAVTIGAAGGGGAAPAAGDNDGNAGTAGGTTSFGSLLSATGGGAGGGGGKGSTGTGGSAGAAAQGGTGGAGSGTGASGGNGTSRWNGGAGGAGVGSATPNNAGGGGGGGASPYGVGGVGGAGGSNSVGGTGTAASGYGAGGGGGGAGSNSGGSAAGGAGGGGSAGLVVVWW